MATINLDNLNRHPLEDKIDVFMDVAGDLNAGTKLLYVNERSGKWQAVDKYSLWTRFKLWRQGSTRDKEKVSEALLQAFSPEHLSLLRNLKINNLVADVTSFYSRLKGLKGEERLAFNPYIDEDSRFVRLRHLLHRLQGLQNVALARNVNETPIRVLDPVVVHANAGIDLMRQNAADAQVRIDNRDHRREVAARKAQAKIDRETADRLDAERESEAAERILNKHKVVLNLAPANANAPQNSLGISDWEKGRSQTEGEFLSQKIDKPTVTRQFGKPCLFDGLSDGLSKPETETSIEPKIQIKEQYFTKDGIGRVFEPESNRRFPVPPIFSDADLSSPETETLIESNIQFIDQYFPKDGRAKGL